MREDHPLLATCPDCRGPLAEVLEDDVRDYRCLVEHRFSDLGLLRAHSETQERVLWAAVVALEEAAVIARTVAARRPASAAVLGEQADEKIRQAALIRAVLDNLKPFHAEE
jgi:hypothetical protein